MPIYIKSARPLGQANALYTMADYLALVPHRGYYILLNPKELAS